MKDSISILLALVLGGILFLWVRHLSYGWRGPSKSGARIPKGSLGWPVIGESLSMTKSPTKFVSSRIKRYGTVFKSNLFLQPNIVGTTPEFAKFVFSNPQIFLTGWPASVSQILGPDSIQFQDGLGHSSVKKLALRAFRPDNLRAQINALETIILRNLVAWEQKGTVVPREATELISIELGFSFLIKAKDMQSTPEGRKALADLRLLNAAILSVPVNMPGTAYRRGLKGKADLTAFLRNILQQRKGQENRQDDVMGALLSVHDDDEVREELKDLDDDRIIDNLVTILFAAYDSSSTTLTWILKYLVYHPDVFSRIQAEHQQILEDKGPSVEGPRLTWQDTRKMAYTSRFLQEVQRIVSIVPWVTRKAAQDIEYEGHLIPKGWGVSPMTAHIHKDPAVFPDPEAFNPDRFIDAPKPYTYLPFGSGPHVCPGMEISKLVGLIFTHHLVTTFSCQSTGPYRGVEFKNVPLPIGGMPVKIRYATKSI